MLDRFETNLKAICPKGTIVMMDAADSRIELFDLLIPSKKNMKFA